MITFVEQQSSPSSIWLSNLVFSEADGFLHVGGQVLCQGQSCEVSASFDLFKIGELFFHYEDGTLDEAYRPMTTQAHVAFIKEGGLVEAVRHVPE